MAKEVKDFIRSCKTCQQHKYSTHKPLGLLQPLPIPQQVWEDLSMDFVSNLLVSQGKTVVWVIVDRLTKYAHFVALPTHFSATNQASIFLSEIYKLHGMPRSIVSDRIKFLSANYGENCFGSMEQP